MLEFLAIAGWLGCAVEPEPLGDASLSFVSPVDGATVSGDPLVVEIDVENFELVPLDEPAADGTGHVDVTLNGQDAAMSTEPVFSINAVADGLYQLQAQLVNTDHTAIEPYAGHTIYITVETEP